MMMELSSMVEYLRKLGVDRPKGYSDKILGYLDAEGKDLYKALAMAEKVLTFYKMFLLYKTHKELSRIGDTVSAYLVAHPEN